MTTEMIVTLTKAIVGLVATSTTAMTVEGIAGIVALVLTVAATYKLAKAFGHGIGYTFGLLLAQPIFTPVIGFGKSKFVAA